MSRMTDFTADPDSLDNQGYLHSQIAQLYHDIASEIRGHGTPIVSAFQKVQNASYAANYASDYQQWLNGAGLEDLEQEAQTHDDWANYFYTLAQQVRKAEGDLNTGPHIGPGGRTMF
jgi:hypothetical protein